MKTHISHNLTLLLGALALSASCFHARSLDFHVSNAQGLQSALFAAANNVLDNSIYLTNGYYQGNFDYNSSLAKNLTLLADPGVAKTQITIDSGGFGSAMSITISGSLSNSIMVQGMTFRRNCDNINIGGLQIAGANSAILVSDCQFLSPSNSSCIGLNITSGLNATVTNCAAEGIPGGNCGTGISITGVTDSVAVLNSTVNNNGSAWGIYGAPYPSDCPGLYVSGASVVSITGCLFSGNMNYGYESTNETGVGGGAYLSGGTLTLIGNDFNGNASDDGGAGAYCQGTTVSLTNNSFTENASIYGYAIGAGGGVYCSATTLTLSANTFTANTNSGEGIAGGAYCSGTFLRACLKTRLLPAETPEHETNHGQIDHGLAGFGLPFVVAVEPPITSEPTEGSFDYPSSRQHLEPVEFVSLHDFESATPHSQGPFHQRARVTPVRPDALDPPSCRLTEEIRQQMPSAVSILNVGGQYRNQQEQANSIHQDVALASVDFLARVVASLVAALCAFDTLAVDDPRAGLGIAPGCLANVLAQMRVNRHPKPIVFPQPEVVIDGPPPSKVRGKIAPLAAGFGEVEDAVEQIPKGVLSWPPSLAGLGKTVVDQLPFGVRKVRSITHPHLNGEM